MAASVQKAKIAGVIGARPHAVFSPANAAATGPTRLQHAAAAILAGTCILLATVNPSLAFSIAHALLLAVFAFAAVWRCIAIAIARPPPRVRKLPAAELPPYTIIVPLYREAEMAQGLVAALSAVDYPKDRLQVLIVLEADDRDTLTAMRRIRAAEEFQVLIAPPGSPKTKPRACTLALAVATGDIVVVYDAEDRPHPLQLQEAAARFARGGGDLVCLQAPLRICGAVRFLRRQFALEYAAQFEVILPALARLGLAFPLGGTSNHFRTAELRAVGGWDAWNVTEDADLGFRLAAQGWRTGMLRTPTWESAPGRLKDWTPQRARWVKGYMQTCPAFVAGVTTPVLASHER
jgi:cellulose synthase/poly-beta-1,6-N-acetylglucosamine synthase-like glycosyltransferase